MVSKVSVEMILIFDSFRNAVILEEASLTYNHDVHRIPMQLLDRMQHLAIASTVIDPDFGRASIRPVSRGNILIGQLLPRQTNGGVSILPHKLKPIGRAVVKKYTHTARRVRPSEG